MRLSVSTLAAAVFVLGAGVGSRAQLPDAPQPAASQSGRAIATLPGHPRPSPGIAAGLPDAVPLSLSSSRILQAPGFSFWGHPQCDGNTNIYFHAAATYNDVQILRLAANDDGLLAYTLPPKYANGATFIGFRVNADGAVRILTESSEGILLFSWASEGVEPSVTRLDVTKGVKVQNFAVWPNAAVQVSGYYGSAALEKLRGKPYVAEFDGSGRLARTFASEAETVDFSKALPMAGEVAAIDPAGQLYFGDGKEVLVFSSPGKLERKLRVPIAEGFSIRKIEVIRGQLVLWLHPTKLKSGDQLKTLFEIVDPQSGEVRRLYEPAPELGTTPLCYTGDAFLFLGAENRRKKLLVANAR